MKIFYSDSPLDLDLNKYSIFLAGPTPRTTKIVSWRREALDILESLNYTGQVIVPEYRIPVEHIDYGAQVEWEHYGTEHCNKIVFWVPRKLPDMMGLTTNVEFGRYVTSGRIIYGRPDDADKVRYLDWLYQKYNNPYIWNNLKELLRATI